MPDADSFTIEHQLSVAGDVATLALTGRLDAVRIKRVESVITGLPDAGHLKVVIDMGGIEWLDSSGARVLIALYKKLRPLGGRVVVASLQRQPKEVFRLLSLDAALPVYASPAEARAALETA